MLRRSSTHRSLGARSDWDSEKDDDGTEPLSATTEDRGRTWSIYKEDDLAKKKTKESGDEHVHKYVQDQLRRLMSPDGSAAGEDELETHLNGN